MASTVILVPIFWLMIIILTAVPVLLGVFVYRDAKARGMEPLLWTLLAIFAPGFIGLIVYLVVRRDHFKLMCPGCGGEVQQTFVSCPTCGQKLSANCANCGTALSPEWRLCPQCGGEVTAGEPFAPPVVVKPQTKGLGVAIAAVLALPLALVLAAVVGFVGLRVKNSQGGSELENDSQYAAKAQIALEEFRQASHYVDLEVLTLDDAKADEKMTNWVKDKQKGKKGIHSSTFFKVENDSISTDQGSGSYALTYAYTVVVVNSPDGKSYAPSEYDYTLCEGIDNSLLIEDVTVTLDAHPQSDSQTPDYSNVFVIKYADGYSLDFQEKDDGIQTHYEATHRFVREYAEDDGDVIWSEITDDADEEPYYITVKLISDKGDKGVKYKIPVRYDKEYYSGFKK